jgi:HlyD family secretion protein
MASNFYPVLRCAGTALAGLAVLSACSPQVPDYYPGYVEAEYIRIAAPVAGTLVKLHVKTGEVAKAGAPAFLLEKENERAMRDEASSHVLKAQATVADVKKGRRPDELAQVRAQLAQAEAAARLSAAEYERQAQLVKAKFVSSSRMDEAREAMERDSAHVNELRAQMRQAHLGARSDEIVAAEKDEQAAQAQLAQADWRLDQKLQKVPSDASVIDIYYREGELVPAGSPVVNLLPPENIKARFFVPESVVGSLRLGQEVQLTCDGCGSPIVASLSFISPSAEYTAPIIYSKENRANLVFMVEARPGRQDAARLHPGQPLEIRLASNQPARR